MVRFSSNVKRPKAVVKQNNPLVSKEAPANISGNYSINKYNANRRMVQQQNQLHGHSRSLLSNSEISVVQEVGLTSSQAIKKLIEEIDRVLRESKRHYDSHRIKRSVPIMRYASLLVSAIWSIWKLKNWLVGAFCTFILLAEVFFIEFIERFRAEGAISDSIREIRRKLRKLDKALLSNKNTLDSVYTLDFKVPVSTATSYIRVIRDGKIRLVCLNLLVPGDFVIILAGEKMPNCCAFQSINLLIPVPQKKQMGLPLDASIVQIEDFPVTQVFQDQLRYPRRTRFVFSMLQERFQSLLSFTIVLTMNNVSIVPLVILSSPLLHFFWWLFGSCYLSLLSDQLIRSETPFKESPVHDSADVDEFDEDAPPPVKNIKIPFGKVVLEALSRLFGWKNEHRGGILRLWDGDVIEALALTSVLCFTDREGPISNSHSRPCELIVPTTSDLELAAIELIPTSADPQRVRPSLNLGSNANDLRAIGLSMLLCTGCGCRTDSPHSKYENILKGLGHFLPEHLQTCYCNLAKEIGFDPLILNRFKEVRTIWKQNCSNVTTGHSHHKHVKRTSTVSILLEDQLEFPMEDDTTTPVPTSHLFTFGEVSDILKISAYTYAKEIEPASVPSGSKVTGLSDSLKRKLVDFEGTMRSCDVRCVAFSYRPVFADELSDDQFMDQQHVFLGLISVCPEPKEHFQEFIDDLEAAGVRFAYFSPYREQPSKAFGERLGLETDWNSCILLSEHPNPASQSPGYSALSDIKARLPRGIEAIRPHLESVDDIPLHVSIFAECNNHNSAEMIRIYQEAGEVVGVIGSCRSIRNSKCFGVAHLAIGFDPMVSLEPIKNGSFDEIALGINANSIKLILPAGSSPYIITELIRESRTILQNSINAWEFVTGSLFCLILTFANSKLTFGEHVVLIFAVLLVALMIVMGPFDGLVMKTHPTVLDSSKCPNQKDISLPFLLSSSTVSIIRFIPSFLGILLFCLLFNTRVFTGILMILSVQSLAFCHAYEAPEFKKIPQLYPKLTIALLTICTMAFIFSSIALKAGIISFSISIIVAVVIGCLCLMWHETIKSVHLKDHYEQAQKRAKLLFNTKLGMHSPV